MNTIEKRNLAEQVEKNKQDILKHFQRDEILADFGIRIIGQVDSPTELPKTADNYGDAYAVGTQSPFNYYIWTRANNLSPVDYWFDFGEIAIAGPQGPKGDRGEKGATGQSTTWIAVFDLGYIDLDEQNVPLDTMVLEYSSGNVYQVLIVNGVKSFSFCLNIKGPQGAKGPKGDKGDTGATGPQGPKGDTGDVGGFVNIAGVLNNEEELPAPYQIDNLTVAYLVGPNKDLYIQIGRTSGTAQWANMGPLNVATMVTVDGQYQNTWNADTKLDKVTTTGYNRAYVVKHNGTQAVMTLTSDLPRDGSIPMYDYNGCLVSQEPTLNNHVATKQYVDSKAGSAGGGWIPVDIQDDAQDHGIFQFPYELAGHYINLIVCAGYGEFDNYDSKHTMVFDPIVFKVPQNVGQAPETVGTFARTISGYADNIQNPTLQLSPAYSTYVNYSFHDYPYGICVQAWYQDLGLADYEAYP